MKRIRLSILFILLLPCFKVLAQNKFKPVPKWLSKAVFYQIYPQSFKDADGDGIGDIKGIIEKLDYVKALGCNAIWINPVFESAYQDAGYDVIDFYKVAKRYGSNQDLEHLFAEAHKRNIKICLDLVAGHTSDQSPWFKASAQKDSNAYSDRYIWTNSKNIKPDKFVSGNFPRDGNYLKNFFDCQPALNYGYAHPNPAHPWEQPVTAAGPQRTRKELRNIIDFWMRKGADGFRVDMASSLIKGDDNFIETDKLWGDIRTWFQSAYPQGVLIAEWSDPKKSIKAGFMIDFMIHFNVPGYPSLFFNKVGVYRRDSCYFSIEGNGSPVEFVKNYTAEWDSIGNNGYISVPTANHDIQRPNAGTRNTVSQLKVVMAFLLTLKGIPFIYYGDEIGMRYNNDLPSKEGSLMFAGANRAGTRTPMQWDNGLNAGFSSTKDTSLLYLPVDRHPHFPNVNDELKEPNSLLNFTKKLIVLRKSNPALGNNGAIHFLYAKANTYPLVYKRSSGGQSYIIVINPSGKKVTAIISSIGNGKLLPVLESGVKGKWINDSLQFDAGAVSYGIFKILNN
jgi:maltose alpha-D-glucosyltransferase/alpha-amylase